MKTRLISLTAVIALMLVGCGSTESKVVSLAVHDSFAVSQPVKKLFTTDSGLSLKIQRLGDAGKMYAAAILAGNQPVADVMFGVDNSLLMQRPAAGLFSELVPIDYGYVCVNIDDEYFDETTLPRPTRLLDLIKPEYKGLLAVEDAAASSPGLAFLLATRAKFGDAWQDYWKKLMANGAFIANDWSEAYFTQFSAGGDGEYPLVVSYSTSPAAEIIYGGENAPEQPRTSVLDDGCFKQTEYAGILSASKHKAAAKKVLSWLQSKEFQSDIPEQMLMYPVSDAVALPEAMLMYGAAPKSIVQELSLSSAEIQQLLSQWQAITGR